MTISDIEILRRNCAEYAKSPKAIDVLRNANGKNHYTDIAKIISMHNTTVSGLLKKAEKLGLAKNIGKGIYKKIPGVLGYMPKTKQKQPIPILVADLTKKLGQKNKKYSPPSGLPIPKNIFNTVNKMSEAYARLYAVENSLRELIRSVLSTQTNWWKTLVPPGIQVEVDEMKNRTPYDAAPRADELEYTHLGQLKEIIVNKRNWPSFVPHLNEKDKNAFASIINKAIPQRNAIGHCIPLGTKDLKVIDVRFDDIIKMIK